MAKRNDTTAIVMNSLFVATAHDRYDEISMTKWKTWLV